MLRMGPNICCQENSLWSSPGRASCQRHRGAGCPSCVSIGTHSWVRSPSPMLKTYRLNVFELLDKKSLEHLITCRTDAHRPEWQVLAEKTSPAKPIRCDSEDCQALKCVQITMSTCLLHRASLDDRTKHFMSDAEYQPTKFLYLPACKALEIAEAPPPPGRVRTHISEVSLGHKPNQPRLAVFIHDPVNTDSDESKSLRKYAAILRGIPRCVTIILSNFDRHHYLVMDRSGQPPFDMLSAAQCIEDLANNVLGRYPLLDVSAWDSQFQKSPKQIMYSPFYRGAFPTSRLLLVLVSIGNLRCKDRTWKLPLEAFWAICVLCFKTFQNWCKWHQKCQGRKWHETSCWKTIWWWT